MNRWQHVRDADRLRSALAYYDQDKPPLPDPAIEKLLKATILTFEESRRHAATLKRFLDEETDSLIPAWNAANALGWHLQFGIMWREMENAASAEGA